jgi:hypothetical protein
MSQMPYEPKKQLTQAEGSVIFDTKVKKNLTPGQWKPEYGPALKGSIRWWDFLKTEAKVRGRQGISIEYRYDKNRKRISTTKL